MRSSEQSVSQITSRNPLAQANHNPSFITPASALNGVPPPSPNHENPTNPLPLQPLITPPPPTLPASALKLLNIKPSNLPISPLNMEAKPSSATESASSCGSPSLKISSELDPRHASETLTFVTRMGGGVSIPQNCNTNAFYDAFIRSFIKVDHIQRGRISCTVIAKPPICNGYGTLHGGAVGVLVEVLSTACARTVVAEDKQLSLGEVSISYLSGTPANEEVLANASVVKTGRNLTVVALEFKSKKNGNLLYITHATFYNMPVSSL